MPMDPASRLPGRLEKAQHRGEALRAVERLERSMNA
jgi:hypothetical protein